MRNANRWDRRFQCYCVYCQYSSIAMSLFLFSSHTLPQIAGLFLSHGRPIVTSLPTYCYLTASFKGGKDRNPGVRIPPRRRNNQACRHGREQPVAFAADSHGPAGPSATAARPDPGTTGRSVVTHANRRVAVPFQKARFSTGHHQQVEWRERFKHLR